MIDAVHWHLINSSSTEWNNSQAHRPIPGVLDLSYANFAKRDLSNFQFINCNLRGVDFDGCNLDACVFEGCDISGASFSGASLVGTQLHGTSGRRVWMTGATIRDADIIDLQITDSSLHSLRIDSTQLNNVRLSRCGLHLSLRNCSGEEMVISDANDSYVTVEDCTMTRLAIQSGNFESLVFHKSTLPGCSLENISAITFDVVDSSFRSSRFHRIRAESPSIQGMDASNSVITQVDLSTFNLPQTALLEASLADCAWPMMVGRVTASGRYVPSPHLPAQCVADLRGVPTLLRRQISDAQHLRDRQRSHSSFIAKVGFRLWGASCAYGQSAARLAFWAAVVVALHALMAISLNGMLIGTNPPDVPLLADALTLYLSNFMGTATDAQSDMAIGSLIFSVRVFGILALGLWISIASVKLTRLGSD